MIDTHCHLASRQFDQTAKTSYINAAVEAGVEHMVTLGAACEDWAGNLAWAQAFPGVVDCALGVHPDDAHCTPADWRQQLETMAGQFPLAAIGEAGLDYFHDAPEGWSPEAFHRCQQVLLEEHFELAASLGLPIVLHTRDREGMQSFEDALAIARAYAGRVRPVFHCFIGTPVQAKRVFDELDGFVSFTGVVTFKSASLVAETAQWCPVDRLMLETDSPYLSPVPLRGRMNQPAHLAHTARFMANLKGMEPEELDAVTTQNAQNFFRFAQTGKKLHNNA